MTIGCPRGPNQRGDLDRGARLARVVAELLGMKCAKKTAG